MMIVSGLGINVMMVPFNKKQPLLLSVTPTYFCFIKEGRDAVLQFLARSAHLNRDECLFCRFFVYCLPYEVSKSLCVIQLSCELGCCGATEKREYHHPCFT